MAYSWDDNGNLLNTGVYTYTYTSNKLSSISGENLDITVQYNGLGERVSQTVNSVTTHYSVGLNAGLSQVLSDGTNSYLYGVGRIAQESTSGELYFLADALGSLRQLTDSAGDITLSKNYQPYGEVAFNAGGGSSSYGFTAEMADITGLIYLRTRYYAPYPSVYPRIGRIIFSFRISEKMLKGVLLFLLIILFMAACSSMTISHQETPTTESTQGPVMATIQTATETIHNTLPAAITSSPPLPTSNPTPTASETPSFTIKPTVREHPGDLYETIFSIPVGPSNIIQYKKKPDSIEGPNAIAVLPNGNFLIADPVSDRLLYFDEDGRLLKTIELGDLEIGYVRDLRVKEGEIFLLETSYQKYRVHRLSADGSLVASEDIPYRFPIDTTNSDNSLEGGLTGIAIDCEGRIILEVIGGSRLFPLSEVQKQPDPANITQGLLCNDKRYFVSTSGLWTDPKVNAGDKIYQTQLTYGFGGLRFLDVLADGSIYLVRDDIVTDPAITVDQTVHYIGADGAVQGTARVPLSEFYYPVMRNTAIGPNGEVFALLPSPDSLDIVRLNFYPELEPLIPGAKDPTISLVLNNQ